MTERRRKVRAGDPDPAAPSFVVVQGCATNGGKGVVNGRDLPLAEKADPDIPGSAVMWHNPSQLEGLAIARS